MELILTQADLNAMPDELRQELFHFLSGTAAAGKPGEAEGARLGREEATALLREVSFHPAGSHLRVLLDHLAYADAARPPTRQRMIEALEQDGAHLGRYLAMLNRITAKATGHPGARLCEYHKVTDSYTAHPGTRALLRELLLTMKASGAREEPLWE